MHAFCQIILSQTLVAGLHPEHEATESTLKNNGAGQDLCRILELAILMPTAHGQPLNMMRCLARFQRGRYTRDGKQFSTAIWDKCRQDNVAQEQEVCAEWGNSASVFIKCP